MISYRQALDMILSTARPLPGERLPLTTALRRVLATTLLATHDMPPFDQSLMDGYALCSADTRTARPETPVRLPLSQTLTAGDVLRQAVPPRQALRIMTGAPMPQGVNTVIKRPRVALVAPGDELLPPGTPLQPGKKWCSNLYALELRAQEVGGHSVNLGIVPDTLDALVERLTRGLEGEVMVVLGASGRGDHDFTTRAMHAVGAEILFRGVATSPGRHITVARHQHTLVFGLPGSPWAAFIGFEIFVRPTLRALLGQRPVLAPTRHAVLTTAVRVRRGVTHFLPARLQPGADGWQATPLATLLAVARVEPQTLGLIIVPPSRRSLCRGARVRVQALTS
jgi:molybdopterin molybdotransferase